MHKRNFKKALNTLKISLKEIHKLQKWMLPVTIFDSFAKSVSPFVNIYMSARIIDELLGPKSVNKLINLVAINITLNLAVHLISTGLDHLGTILKSIMAQNQDMQLNEKIISMDYEHVENPKVHLLRSKIADAENMMGGSIISLVEYLGDFTKGFVTIITSIVLVINLFKTTSVSDKGLSFINSSLFSYGFLALLLIGTAFSLKFKTTSDKKMFGKFSKIMDTNRIFRYYFGQTLDYHLGKEIRLCNQKEIISKEAGNFTKLTSKMFNNIGNMYAIYSGLEALITSFLSGAIYIFVGLKAISGAISIGSIVQYTGSINQFMTGSKKFLASINAIINNNQYLQLYIDFLNIESDKYKGTIPIEKRDDDEYEIEFKNVSFKYPGTDIYTLKNVSMKLDIGERLAIVGMNGSGKTTFIKLLCRLYDPNEGEILLNGINIKKYNYDEYMKLFSVVFQDFKLFSFMLGQNVAASVEFNDNTVESVLDKAGFKQRLKTMPNGIHTSLYKDFDEDGVEISGGEAQKIALARALYRDAPIVILDEPTAAIDPIAEFEIYSKFNEIVGTKTAFYISHRLSSCRFCNQIAVFHTGEIVQKGSHEELLKDENGKYYELWYAQAKYYTEEVSA